MSSGKDNNLDWTAHGTPSGERVGPGLSGRHKQPAPAPARTAHTRSSVMDTLLGENKLAAFDASGNDPYNTTGKFVRR
jgi:hypothetical protein